MSCMFGYWIRLELGLLKYRLGNLFNKYPTAKRLGHLIHTGNGTPLLDPKLRACGLKALEI